MPVSLENPKEVVQEACDSYGSAEFIKQMHNYRYYIIQLLPKLLPALSCFSLPSEEICKYERRKLSAFIQKIHSYRYVYNFQAV